MGSLRVVLSRGFLWYVVFNGILLAVLLVVLAWIQRTLVGGP